MSRRGNFGQQPRVQPSIWSTLIAIAREQEAQRDQNIMDAWQKGGEFEGKPVTDEDILAHWQARMDGLSKDDPNYDKYQEAFTQYTYAIEESKASTKYAQGKLTDMQMAQFYLKWAKHPGIPKNGEFYRVLQRDAAQFMRASKQKSEAEAKRLAEQKYQDGLGSIHKKNEAGGEYITDVLTNLAQVGNAGVGIVGLIGAPGSGSDLTQFDSSDPEQMLRLLRMITPAEGQSPDERANMAATTEVLYHDVNGKPVTGTDIAAKLKGLDPGFSGRFDLGYVKGLIKDQLAGIQKRIDLAEKTGHVSDANQFRKQQEYVAALGRQVNAWPVEQSYMHAREAFQKIISNPTALPEEKLKAYQTYQSTLLSLAKDPQIEADDRMKSALVGEAEGKAGTVTMAESFSQAINPDNAGAANSDVAQTKLWTEAYQKQVDLLHGDPQNYVYTQGVYDNQGNFTPRIGGPSYGVADVGTVKGLGGNPQHIFVPTSNGAPTAITIVDAPILAQAKNPDGSAMPLDNSNPVASVYMVSVGGTQVKVYGVDGPQGRFYTTEEPWDTSRVRATQTDSGIVLDLSSIVAPGAAGFTVRQTAKATNDHPAVNEVFMDPKAAALGSSSTRNAAGMDPTTDFFSPTLAALMSSAEGKRTLQTLMKDPLFLKQLDTEAHQSAGMTQDPKTGAWLGDATAQSKFNSNMSQVQNANFLALPPDQARAALGGLWDKLTTIPALITSVIDGSKGNEALKPLQGPGINGLPLDSLGGTPLAAMGAATQPGSNILLKGKEADDQAGFQLQLQGNLKLPSFTPPTIKPAPTVTPSPTPGATIQPFVPPPVPAQSVPQSGGSYGYGPGKRVS